MKQSDIESGRTVYTCNCGWVDKGHADGSSLGRPYVGAQSLWDQILYEKGKRIVRDGKAVGHQVRYRQGMGRKLPIVGMFRPDFAAVDKQYFVKSSLIRSEKESVALAIFTDVSRRFESLQADWWLSSGFSIEDLVSNLIGFYSVVRPGTDYMKLCKEVSKDAALKIWNEQMTSGAPKNYGFEPKLYSCPDCAENSKFPSELQKIKPAQRGRLWRYWTISDDIDSSFTASAGRMKGQKWRRVPVMKKGIR